VAADAIRDDDLAVDGDGLPGAARIGGRVAALAPWALGLVVAVVWLGPALGPGSLFNLDLILPQEVPVPRGAWGLGPELPRRVPFMLPAAWLSPLVGGDTVGKAMLVATIGVAFVGAYRLVADRSRLAAVGAGLVFSLSPFLLTRLAVGHVMIALSMALLPWAYPTLLRPGEHLERTLLWCAAFGFTGNYGGMVALVVVAAGLVTTRFRRAGPVFGVWLLAQLPWLVPGLVVYLQGTRLADSTGFATVADGPAGIVSVLAGHGFWNTYHQVGWAESWVVAPLALVLGGLALVGHRELPGAWRTPAAALAAIGLVVALVSTVSVLRPVTDWLTSNPVGQNVRESQRLLPLYLAWMAPAAGLGAARLGRRLHGRPGSAMAVTALPLAVALVLAGPGAWGLGGQLAAVPMPADWESVRDRVVAEPGTAVVVPWEAYADARLGGVVRHVLNPWPIYLGGDVIVSSDLRTSTEPTAERADPREPRVRALAAEVVEGRPVSEELARLGVRWVVFHRVGSYRPYESLERDAGLERVVTGTDVFLYRVRDWPGAATGPEGEPVAVHGVVEPLARLDPSGPVTWHRPAAGGWLRGTAAAGETEAGAVALPGGSGPVWFWPSLVVLLADAITVVGVIWAGARWRRERRPKGAEG
jgi:hypothetical protein